MAFNGPLSVSGRRIVDALGRPTLLRGANMMSQEWDSNMTNERLAFPVLANNWGGNLIVRGFASGPVNSASATYLAALDEYVSLGAANEIFVAFVYRTPLQNGATQPELPDAAATQALTALAARYSGEDHVIFGLQVEPHGASATWAAMRPLFESMITQIRGVGGSNDPNFPLILVPGFNWSRDLSGAIANPVNRPNVVYKTHPYNASSEFQALFGTAHDAGLPVLVGEFAPTVDMDQDDVEELLTFVRTRGIPWAGWLFDTRTEALLADWTGTPTSPFGVSVRNEMLAPSDPLAAKVLGDLDAWGDWLDDNGVEGTIGEFGFPGDNYGPYGGEQWPGDAVDWRTLGEAYYDRMQTHDIWSLQWGCSESFAAYELAPYTGPAGVLTTARPQSVPLENHLADVGVRRGVALTGLEFGDWHPDFSNTTPGALGVNGQIANTQPSWNYLRSRGITLARIGFRWERLQPTLGGALNATYLGHIQTQVARAAAATGGAIDVVLDLHNYGEYRTGAPGSVVTNKLGSAALTQAHFVDVWDRLSAVFAASANVVGYGLMNEPHDLPGGAAGWQTLSQAAYNAVRANDATTEVYVAGHNWGKVQGWAAQHPTAWITGTNVRYEAHHYWDTASSEDSVAESSVYGQTYDSAVADLSPTVYVRTPKPDEVKTVSPITVTGVRDTSGSTTVTVRIYPVGSGTATHTQAVVTSSREWSLLLSTDLGAGDWEATATQGAVVSPRRAFEQVVPVAGHFAMSRGPTGSHWGPDADLGTGEWTRTENQYGSYVDDPFACAADFYDACAAINHHFVYLPEAMVPTAITRMQEIGIRHVRVGLASPAFDGRLDFQSKTAQAGLQVRSRNASRGPGIQPISFLWGTYGCPAQVADVNDNDAGYFTITNTNGNFLRPLDGPGGANSDAGEVPPVGPAGGGGGWPGTYTDIGWTDVGGLQGTNEPPDYHAGYTGPWGFRQMYVNFQNAKNARTTEVTLAGEDYIDFRTGLIEGSPAHAPQVPVLGFGGLPGPSQGPDKYDLFGDYTSGTGLDFGAPHIYWHGHEPWFGSAPGTNFNTTIWPPWGAARNSNKYSDYQFAVMTSYNGAAPGGPGRWAKTLPMVCTETGYYTVPGEGGNSGCVPDVVCEYLIRTMLQNYIGGIKRTYWYRLMDEGPSVPNMGVCDINGIPKAPYWAFKNLLGMVGFREPSAPTPISLPVTGFVPGPTNKIAGDPAWDTSSPDRLDKLIIQTADSPQREYLVFFSRNRTIFQRVTGLPSYGRVNVADPQTITIQLPAGNWTATVAEPAKNPVSGPSGFPRDGLTYPNPTNGSIFSATGVAGRDVLVPDGSNRIRLGVAGLTRVVKLTAVGGPPVPVVSVTDPTPSETVADATPLITGVCGNAAGDSADVTVTLYAGTTASGSPVQGPTTIARSGTAWSWTPATLPEGAFTVRATQAGTSGTSAPADRTFSVLLEVVEPPPVPPPPPIRVTVREKPRTDLHAVVTTPGGRRYRWSDTEPKAENALGDLRFSTSMPGGFETLDGSLARKPKTDYADLKRLTDIDVRSPGGSQVFEGRLERSPRSSGDRLAISPSAVGYQAELEDNKHARFLGVDRDLGAWGPMSAQRWLNLDATGPDPFAPSDPSVDWDDDNTAQGLKLQLTAPWAVDTDDHIPICEGWYDAKGLDIGALFYAWKKSPRIDPAGTDTQWFWAVYLSSNAVATSLDSSGNLRAAGPAGGVLLRSASGRKFALVNLFNNDTVDAAYTDWLFAVWFTGLAVIGDHGLPVRTEGSLPTGRVGLYASDIVRHVVPKFAPRLKVTSSSVQASNFLIDQFAHLEPTTAAELVKEASRLELQDWAVWGNRTFYWNRRGARGKHWRARLRPSQLSETGPAMDRLFESVVIKYQDVAGITKTVGPPGSGADTESPLLKDSDPQNPANQLGKIRRDILEMGVSTAPMAIEVGYRFLQETKLLDRSGQATLVGHVRDDHGVLFPASRVRAGDDISFIDASDRSARRIVHTSYEHSTRSCQVDLDAPPAGLAALLDRFQVRLAPHGL